jgi:hypothetical protein
MPEAPAQSGEKSTVDILLILLAWFAKMDMTVNQAGKGQEAFSRIFAFRRVICSARKKFFHPLILYKQVPGFSK